MRRTTLVGLLALTLPLAACNQEAPSADPAPDPTTSAAVASAAPATAIPDDFPLADEMDGDEKVRVTLKSVGMRALDFCGRKPLRGLTLTDRRTAEASGPEYAQTRDLMLFADPEPPAAVLDDIRSAASNCPAESTGPTSRLLREVTDSPLGEDAATILTTYEQGGKVGVGAEIIVAAVVGRALLVTSTYAEWDPATNLDTGVADETQKLEAAVAAMSVFRNEPASPSVPES